MGGDLGGWWDEVAFHKTRDTGVRVFNKSNN